MQDRLQRIEFFSLYELYLRKNEEFRRAVHSRTGAHQLDELRECIRQIYGRLTERRGYARSPRDGRSAP